MKKSVILLLLILNSLYLFSQTKSQHRVYIPAIVGTGYSYELRISDEFTLSAKVDYKLSMGGGDYDDLEFSDIGFDRMAMQARIYLEPRYYFNFDKRNLLKKDITNNAASYVSIVASYDIPGGLDSCPVPPEAISIEPSLGWVRNIGYNTNIEFSVYLGMKHKRLLDSFYPNYDAFYPEPNEWGWVISAGFRLSVGLVFN